MRRGSTPGYASDPLAQRPLKWLMDKAGALRDQVVIDTLQVAPPVTDSYRSFGYGLYRFISRPFYRLVGPAPDQGTQATTSRINETIDGSPSVSRWRSSGARRRGIDDDAGGEGEGCARHRRTQVFHFSSRPPAVVTVERDHPSDRRFRRSSQSLAASSMTLRRTGPALPLRRRPVTRCRLHAQGRPIEVPAGLENVHLTQKTIAGRMRVVARRRYDAETDRFVDFDPAFRW
jgi:hypothetical protein